MRRKLFTFLLVVFVLNILVFDVFATNNEMIVGTVLSGAHSDETRYSYDFELDEPGKLTITFSTECDVTSGEFGCFITGNGRGNSTSWKSLNGKFTYSISDYLEQGEYTYNFSCSGNGIYTIDSKFEPVKESFEDTKDGCDNTVETANYIDISKTYYGLIMNADVDLYCFSLNQSCEIEISLNCHSSSGWFLYSIYDDNLDLVIEKDLRHYDKLYGGTGKYLNTHKLNAGKYYLLIEAKSLSFGGPYDFSIQKKHIEHVYDNACDNVCNDCGQTREVSHNYGRWTTNGDITHVRSCLICDINETANHVWDDFELRRKATCVDNGLKFTVCLYCGESKEEIIYAEGHKEKNILGKVANCTEAGLTDGSMCSVCGEVITAQKEIPALGHKFADGKCSVCGAKDPNYVDPKPENPVGPTPTPVDNPFKDVKDSDWFYNPVMWAYENNVTGGTSETTFGPDDSCTRAQVVTFLWAANGKPEPKSMDNPFTDVADNAWYLKPVLWAVEQGITGGVAEGKFGPENTCTRAQIATFLFAAAGKPVVKGSSAFGDVAGSDWFAKPVIWAAENNVTGGIGGGKFGPNNTCTRAQVVTFLYRVYGDK